MTEWQIEAMRRGELPAHPAGLRQVYCWAPHYGYQEWYYFHQWVEDGKGAVLEDKWGKAGRKDLSLYEVTFLDTAETAYLRDRAKSA